MSVAFDMTLNLSVLIQTGIFLVGGIVALVTLKNTVTMLKQEVAESKTETKKDIDGIQTEIKKISELLTAQALSDERISTLTKRQDRLEKLVDDLRRGAGWITSQRSSVDGQYP